MLRKVTCRHVLISSVLYLYSNFSWCKNKFWIDSFLWKMLLTRVWRDTGWCLTNRPVFLSTIENSNFKPTFLLVFNSSPPPSPISKSAERISTFSANFQQFVEIYCFCTAFVYSHITFISIFEQKVGRVRSGRWQQMDTVFPPQNFLYVDAKKEIQPSHIYSPSKFTQVLFMCRI